MADPNKLPAIPGLPVDPAAPTLDDIIAGYQRGLEAANNYTNRNTAGDTAVVSSIRFSRSAAFRWPSLPATA